MMADLKQQHTPGLGSIASNQYGNRQLPTVVCFVPSLPHEGHFHVSVHLWEPPKPSPEVVNSSPGHQAISFEARVVIDGTAISGLTFKAEQPTPHRIDNFLGPDGLSKHLAFPPFHPELLTQHYWNASEDLGRIKIIISEGTYCNHQDSSFERRKNIVCFAFQHAPLSVLEEAKIAWPNPSMLRCLDHGTGYTTYTNLPNPTSHTHSQRYDALHQSTTEPAGRLPHIGTPEVMHPSGSAYIYEGPNSMFAHGLMNGAPQTNFMMRQRSRTNRTSLSDTSMPDYVSLRSWEGGRHPYIQGDGPRSLGETLNKSMSDIVYTGLRSRGHTGGTRDDSLEGLPEEMNPMRINPIDEEALTPSRFMNHILQTYDGTSPSHGSGTFDSSHFNEAYHSPDRDTSALGTLVPANTRVNSRFSTPSMVPSPNFPPEDQSPCLPLAHARTIPAATKVPLPNMRDMSRESQASAGSVDQSNYATTGRTHALSPDAKVKGRKEGKQVRRKSNGISKKVTSRKLTEGKASSPTVIEAAQSEGKRKREVGINHAGAGHSTLTNHAMLSPARQISRVAGNEETGSQGQRWGPDEEDKTGRNPLGDLLNH